MTTMPATTRLRQSVLVHAPPREVYDALLDATTLSRVFGQTVQASAAKGGEFHLFGRIHGANLEVSRGKRLVQSFRYASPEWPMEHLSKVTVQLRPVPDGTRIILDHSNIPAPCLAAVAEHWRDHLWPGLKGILENRPRPMAAPLARRKAAPKRVASKRRR